MRDKIFTCIILSILFVVPLIIVFRNEKDISLAENRTLFKKSNIRITNLNNDLESFFQDQFVMGERLKKEYNQVKNKIITISMKIIEKTELMKLIPVSNEIYRLANTDYFVYGEESLSSGREKYEYHINRINELSEKYDNIKFYVYNHITDKTITNQQIYNDFFYEVLDKKIAFKHSSFVNSYEDYKKFFYKTDHHWNKDGSYMGYLEIAELLGIENPISVSGTRKFEDIKFYGSKARVMGNFEIYDVFEVNTFEYPEMEVEINYKKVDDYGRMTQYFNNEDIDYNQETNHYGEFYGWDNGIVKFTVNENREKGSILVFSNSYSNPLNKLIASSYNETYVVDMRYYETEVGEKFDFEKFVSQNHIDKVLIISNNYYYMNLANYIQ